MSQTLDQVIRKIRLGTTADVAEYLDKLCAMMNDANSRIRLSDGEAEGCVVIQLSSELAYQIGEVLTDSVKILRNG